ncbi:MAG: hypothetical protein SGJ10_05565 [Bacteroidota bacterium]|nr:hypothetical protein [Bacteroidota bacterium]
MSNLYNTPILIIAFNRYDTTVQVFEMIKKLKPKYLYIAVDGPRKSKEGEAEKVENVKSIFNNIDWECEVHTLFRKQNLGCKMGVSSAITWFFEQVEMGIIIEDDILLDPTFFNFAEEMLEYYKDEERVMDINAVNFQPKRRTTDSYYFSKYALVWGWATWRRAWAKYDVAIKDYNKNILSAFISNKKVLQQFDKKFSQIISNELDTWDYQWNYTIWKNSGLCITPEFNMCYNIGFGVDATHTGGADFHASKMKMVKMEFPVFHPDTKNINIKADQYYELFAVEPSLYKRLLAKYFPELYRIYIKLF